MPTECSRDLFGYEAVEGRQVMAAFDGGEVTSDAGALLLGAAGRAVARVVGPCSGQGCPFRLCLPSTLSWRIRRVPRPSPHCSRPQIQGGSGQCDPP